MRPLTGFTLAVALVAMAMLAVACDQAATSPDQVALEPPMLMEAGVLPPNLADLSVLDEEIEELLAGAAAGGNTVTLKDDATGGDCFPAHGTWDAPTKTCTLTSDVFDAIEFDFDSPGLTLDCAGHQVNGTTLASPFVGVFIFAANATVTRCEIIGFIFAVVPFLDDGHSITDNSIHDNSSIGILLVASDNTLIRDNSIHDNGRRGIQLSGSNNNRIIDNSVHDNDSPGGFCNGFGIRLFNSSQNLIAQNHSSGHSCSEIQLLTTVFDPIITSNNVIEENTLDTKVLGGISGLGTGTFPGGPFFGPSNNVIRNNKITVSSERGFLHDGIALFIGVNGNLIEGNDIVSSDRGIGLVTGANGNTVVSNRIRLLGSGPGIALLSGSRPVSNDNNVFLDNVISHSDRGTAPCCRSFGSGAGIFIQRGKGNRVEGNKINMTDEAGIFLDLAEDTDVTRNVVKQAGTNSLLLIDSRKTDVWLNDFSLSEETPVTSDKAIKLSVSGLGNWWNGDCGKGLFVKGVDSNSPNVVDRHPFNHSVAHIAESDVLPPKECP